MPQAHLHPLQRQSLISAAKTRITQADTPMREQRAQRDLLLLKTLIQTGMRISEAAHFTPNDLERDATGHPWIHIRHSKSGPRKIPLQEHLAAELEAWTQQPHHMWPNSRLEVWGINQVLKKIGALANLPFTALTLRSTFARRLLNRGVPIHHVQKLMGHKHFRFTLRYLLPTEADLIRTVNRLESY